MTKLVLTITGGLVTAGILTAIAFSFASGKADAANEVRVQQLTERVAAHDEHLDKLDDSFAGMRVLLERIDQRSIAIEKKLDAPRRGNGR